MNFPRSDILFSIPDFSHWYVKYSFPMKSIEQEYEMELPKKYKVGDIEKKWSHTWVEQRLYAYDPSRSREDTFSVDTPPPTVSGSLHVGHIFSYSHQDFIVRYKRMTGKNIFFPIGWDDNGLPTERRVQNLFNVRCAAHLHYDPDFKRERGAKGEPLPVSRRNFIELCNQVTREDEEAFRYLWTRLGMSYDWQQEYATIDEHCRRTSQLSFLELLERGEIYQSERPVMWDVDFCTAIAQAEVVDKDVASAYHFLRFPVENTDQYLVIATTRPELLAACVAVLVHPDDERYKNFVGKKVLTPLFHAPVPVMADSKADPEKGTGVVMVCTFGDQTDVEWQRKYQLPIRQILNRDGHLAPVTFVAPDQMDDEHRFVSINPDSANEIYREIQGKYVKQARRILIALAEKENGVIDRPSQPISHAVRFFEKGERPLEYIPTRQWFCRILEHKEALIEQGKKIQWHPDFMGLRYERWVEGLNQDWCLSRQRFFGVPIPVWYPIDDDGKIRYEQPILPKRDQLPVDPLDECPEGYSEEQRDQPGGFTGDPDVLDTWATSSLTPQIAGHWADNDSKYARVFPMDMRPQSHEIIRTWAFYTIVKAFLHGGDIPWKHVVISGWILDPDRKKMSKSQGNVVTPEPLIEQFGADSVRYWAARARLGVDTAYDEQVFRIGKRLCTKLFNASKFVIGRFEGVDLSLLIPDKIVSETDRAIIAELRPVIRKATDAFERFDYAQALQVTEEFFWQVFCDNYLELAKSRTYEDELNAGRLSALTTLYTCLRVLLRLFAPFIPYLTEEIWDWLRKIDPSLTQSIHVSSWPSMEELEVIPDPHSQQTYPIIADIVTKVRKVKADKNLSMKAPISSAKIVVLEEHKAVVESVWADIKGMLHIEQVEIISGTPENALTQVEVVCL